MPVRNRGNARRRARPTASARPAEAARAARARAIACAPALANMRTSSDASGRCRKRVGGCVDGETEASMSRANLRGYPHRPVVVQDLFVEQFVLLDHAARIEARFNALSCCGSHLLRESWITMKFE